jgi:hypothetical protein
MRRFVMTIAQAVLIVPGTLDRQLHSIQATIPIALFPWSMLNVTVPRL